MMAETETDHGFEGDQETATATTTSSSFSQLLFGGGHDDDGDALGPAQSFNYTCSSFAVKSTPKMLCFGGCHPNDAEIVLGKPAIHAAPKAGLTCSDSSSTSSGNNTKSMQCRGAIVEAQPTRRRTNKRSKVENPTTGGHAKVRKEKIGDRINALQQLVSPFGKIRHQYSMKQWVISGSCMTRFKSFALLICNTRMMVKTTEVKNQERN
ncbi:transcription factor bHLH113 isoform X2 [Gossypium arboreum]|uniref:transcription factor bHLH113 isoform X2 n=1 Tax=Gossypium arboreum TaxID=29729 RepID=UPI000818F910|nr:transcription factor bHLH113 isoform X2 [Gossypium arboreum]